jgi:predicted dinucleotide-binding enzyme
MSSASTPARSRGPSSSTPPTPIDISAMQAIAAEAPEASVVKAFNTTFAGTLVAGQVGGRPLDVFLAGDDGPLAGARELEAAGLCTWQSRERSDPPSQSFP